MASTLKKNSSVDDVQYNDLIKTFASYYQAYQKAIKDIVVNQVAKTVMVDKIWTDQYAADYALWFTDESGVTDGCDRLNNAMVKMEALFQTICFKPVKDVVKLLGRDTLNSCPMIKKAYNSSNIYNILGVKKYRKGNFPKLNLKRKRGWKAVTQATKINQMMTNIEKDIKAAKTYADKIQKLVTKEVLTPGDRCIEVSGFNDATLKGTMKDINTCLDNFQKMSSKKANSAIESLNKTQSSVVTNMQSVTEEK